MDLPILTAPTTNKPWLNIYANSVTANTLTAVTSLVVPSLTVSGNMEVKGDLLVDGYSASTQFNGGFLAMSSNTQTVAVPAGTGGNQLTFNSTLNKLTASGIAGAATCFDTINGSTLVTLATPIASLAIEYSPDLNIYTAIDIGGTAVYTSPNATAGSFILQAPAPSAFAANNVQWISYFGRFYTCSADLANRIYQSTNGITWSKQASTRDVFNFAFSPLLNRLVAVGAGGPQYTDDGKTWIVANTAQAMSNVCWSDYWKCWVATPRGAPLTSVYRSVDGIIWTSSVGFPGVAGNLRSITWIQDYMLFVVAGDSDVLWISQNGLAFRQVQVVATTMASYGAIYIPKWSLWFSSGIGGFVRVSPKRLIA